MTEAERLAQELIEEADAKQRAYGYTYPTHRDAAALIRSQAAEIEALRSAAIKARTALSELLMTRDPIVYSDALKALDAAIDAARQS